LNDKGKFKFDHEVSNEVLQQHKAKVVQARSIQDGPIHP